MARGLAVVLALMMTLQTQAQQEAAAQRALLPVKVNETDRGEVHTWIGPNDILVARGFIDDLRIPLDAGSIRTIEGEAFVSLASLAPRVSWVLDEANLILALTVDPELLGKRELELGRRSVISERGGDPSAFFNYGILGSGGDAPALAMELGGNRGHQFLYTGINRTTEGDVVRGLSFLNMEWPRDLRRVTFGDSIVSSDFLGGQVTIGGVTLTRQFSLQPYFITTPALDLQGTATTPSVVEVYVNGQLTNRVAVDPGSFTLRDLPATSGFGNATIVVRDAFGRETSQQQSFYYSSFALRKGLSDYTFSLGALRPDLNESFDYGDPAGLAYYRRGITDHVTLGGRVEGSTEIVSGGPTFTYAGLFGDLDIGAAASGADGRTGYAGSVTYRFSAPRYSFGLNAVHRSDDYANLSLTPEADRTVVDLGLFGSINFRRFSIGLAAGRNELRDGEDFDRLALQTNTTIGRRTTLFVSLGATEQNGQRDPEVIVGLTYGFGRDTANLQFNRVGGEDSTVLQVRRPVGLANGFGYSVAADTAADRQLATVDYQTSFGRYQIVADPEELDQASYNVAGGLLYIGGRLTAARPLTESYALARVGVPGVELFNSNQSVGRTNEHGDLVVTSLLPHYLNQLRVNDDDIPLEYEIAGTEVEVVPPTRGGVIATFPVRRLRSYSGRIVFVIIGADFPPSLGEMVVTSNGEEQVVPLGRNGEFYVDNLDPGTYPARLRIGKVHCDFSLQLPDGPDAITDLGEVRCEK